MLWTFLAPLSVDIVEFLKIKTFKVTCNKPALNKRKSFIRKNNLAPLFSRFLTLFPSEMHYRFYNYLKENSISLVIAFVLVLAISNSIVSYLENQCAKKFEATSKDIAKVKSGLNMINTHANLADMAFRGYFIIEDQQILHPFTDQVLIEFGPNFDTLFTILNRQGFDASKVAPVEKQVGEYMNLIKHLAELRKQQRLEEIVRILKEDPGYAVWKVYDKFIKETTILEDNLERSVLEDYENISSLNFYLQILLLLFGMPTLLLSFLRIRKNNILKQQLFNVIEENNRKFIFDPNNNEIASDQKVIINSLIENLKKISHFIKAITKGDYTVNWEGLNDESTELNKDNIVGDLINMSEQMRSVKEQDEKRLWVTEGISKFSEIVRTYQNNVDELCYEVVSNLVRYINANQGGIFVVNDTEEEIYLELKACYAYQKKKFLEKRIGIGQGLVGQAYLEKGIIYLTTLPDHYIAITSGLGEANPKSLIIIPLKYNDKIEAVIEIASFNQMNQHEIEFMQKVGEYIASAISVVKTNERTKALLLSTQDQAEEMRSQEEEMRQSMEELQATQEEVQRRTLEYQDRIELHEEEIKLLKSRLKKHEPVEA